MTEQAGTISASHRRPAGRGEGGFGGGRDASGTTADSARLSRHWPPKLYRIGEVVSYSGLSRQTIHNYTTMGLIQECHWTPGGHRLYDQSVFQRLDEIAELKASNRSLAEIREHFAGQDAPRTDEN
ncbi:MAG: MerR family transcriptional regulator [Phycisphaerae bacterium]